jgi:transposase InsO family protein
VKARHLKYTVSDICNISGYSRQAYYKRRNASYRRILMESIILDQVHVVRRRQPKIGARKLYFKIKPLLLDMGYKFGRDQLFDLLRRENMLIRRRRKYTKTTDSRHRFTKYCNLIRELEIKKPNQVYVADITYIRTLEGFCYLSLITDACSRKIVGYNLSRDLGISGCMKALKMALRHLPKGLDLIHHSDRGIQYCSYDYTDILQKNSVRISMTERDHVYENSLAERVNGILKDEFMLGETLASYKVAANMVKESIQIYNQERPHLSLNYKTPEQRHAA